MSVSRHSAFSSVALLSLLGSASGCQRDERVTSRLDVGSAVGAVAVTSITGRYGATCNGRSAMGDEPWTISRIDGPAEDELSVVRNDSNCLLTIDNIVTADGVYIGAPPITLDTGDEYEESASAFAIAGEGSFFRANAKISALTFATDFTISLIVSDTLSASDEGSISATPFIRLPDLLRARSFAALSAQTLTNTGSQTVIAGDLGVSPGTSVTGLPVGQPSGVTYRGTDSPAVEAQTDLTTLYNDLVSRNCPIANRLSGQDLADKTLPPGVYCFASTASLGVGTLTLDAKGKPGAVWIFQVGSALNVAPSSVNVINGGTACNVFWQVGSSATLLGNALFAGNLVVYTSVTLNNGAAVAPGRVLVRTGAVTLDTNHVSSAACQ